MAELIDEARMKEKDYQLALEDSRRSERKLEDNKRNLEIALDNTNAEAGELRVSEQILYQNNNNTKLQHSRINIYKCNQKTGRKKSVLSFMLYFV